MNNAVLSQADIDSLLAGQAQAQAVRAPEEEAPLPRVIKINAGGGPPPSAEPNADVLKEQVARLEERLGMIEAAGQQANEMARELSEIKAAVSQLQQYIQALVAHSQQTAAQIGGISTNLQGTPVYGLKQAFTCGHCHSKGNVAVRIRCTGCGQESWWGYFPPRK